MKKNKIIQLSFPGTGSTVLINIIHGLLCPDKAVTIGVKGFPHNRDIIKTHIYSHCDPNEQSGRFGIDRWQDKFSNSYNLYFICSERKGLKNSALLDKKYHTYNNVLIIPYEKLLETSSYTVEDIVSFVAKKIKAFLPRTYEMKEQFAIDRIKKMNKTYEKIKDKPFSYCDKFFHIHGSHRGRIDKN